MREFRDEAGTTWTVRHIVRVGGKEGAVRPGLENGWLLFDSGSVKRRLGPVPEAWETLDAPTLSRLCGQALPVQATAPMLRMEAALRQSAAEPESGPHSVT